MKKVIIAVAVLLMSVSVSFAELDRPEIIVKGSLQAWSGMNEDLKGSASYGSASIKLEESSWTRLDTNIAFALESYLYYEDTFAFGLGVSQQLNKKSADYNSYDSEFSFTSVYVTAKKIIIEDLAEKDIYLLGQVGLSYIRHNFEKIYQGYPPLKDENGYYFAAGIGCHDGNFIFELTGSLNTAKISMNGVASSGINIDGESRETNYNLNLTIGYRLKFYGSNRYLKNRRNDNL
jgi:hypothetical protein